MKFTNKLLIIIAVVLGVTSCYDDYVDDFEEPNMGFAVDKPLRTVISERDMSIYIGVSIGGKREVDLSDWAKFTIDPTLLEGTGKVLLPETHYTLADKDHFRVRKSNLPVADVRIDFTEAFYNDPLSLQEHYALPFRMIENSLGVIREGGETTVAVIKYISTYAGTYYRMGQITETDALGNVIGSPVSYGDTYDINKSGVTTFKSTGTRTLTCPGVGNKNESVGSLTLTLSADNHLTIAGVSGATTREASGSYKPEGEYEYVANAGKLAPQFDLVYAFTCTETIDKVEVVKHYNVVEKLVLRQDPLYDLIVETW